MSITKETALAHAKDPAVTCCRFEEGTVLDAHNLEDPAIFPDLIDTGLLDLTKEVLPIGAVLGAKLRRTLDALTPITKEDVEEDSLNQISDDKEEPQGPKERSPRDVPAPAQSVSAVAPQGSILIHIGKGEDIHLEIPLAGYGTPAASGVLTPDPTTPKAAAPSLPHRVLRTLERKHFPITQVRRGPKTVLEGTVLTLREGIEEEAAQTQDLVVSLRLDLIPKERYGDYSETILDVQPLAVKESGDLGVGVTRVLDGVVLMVTGTDELGVQIGEFGSSEGPLDRNIMWGRPGAPDFGEIFIKTQVTIKAHTNMERRGPLAAHKASDYIAQEIRDALKEADPALARASETFTHSRTPGKKKLLVVKEIMGQGAMHDNLILPTEPVGTLGAKPNVDLGNLPVVLSPLEILDGGIHALTCIGPASKETSRHYFREPLVLAALQDEEVDLYGVVLVGSPQINSEKFYVSQRLGMLIEAVEPDGVIITTEGFGNNHIDFAAHHEEVGKRGIPVVGMTFSAVQGALVVGNEYMTHMVDLNKSRQGIENEILENNCLAPEDAVRAMAMIKAAMAGEPVAAPERKYNRNVKLENLARIEEVTGVAVTLEPNEEVLAKSEKRAKIYEKDE
ncbi:D-proline reductase, 45 kDa subunit [Clostridiaceae bacterium JG1575]|nr:D-proline reductase, 45 kDa subunit [Clostridiaceae bacterium JG1575]